MITQWIKETLRGGDRVSIDYPNDGYFMATKGYAYIKYSNGDCIFLNVVNGEYQVYQIETDDGILYKY
jgi:hypothetical protein